MYYMYDRCRESLDSTFYTTYSQPPKPDTLETTIIWCFSLAQKKHTQYTTVPCIRDIRRCSKMLIIRTFCYTIPNKMCYLTAPHSILCMLLLPMLVH